jgi:myo-inositol 2-dehydrogenase / D-chiro-inositol 1-dehydrogenase
MVKRLNIAVVGLGRMGKRHVHTLISRVPRANVVAVCSSEPTEVAWAKKNYADDEIAVYKSYDAMLEHSGLEAVWISSSTDVHASQTLAGIKKGLHVLCEKPLSTDLEEVRTGTS